MDRVAEIHALLEGDHAELTDEQIAELESELLSIFDAIRAGEHDEVDRNDVETLTAIVADVETLREEAQARLTAAAETESQIDELAARLSTEDEASDGDASDGGESEDVTSDEGEAPAEGDGDAGETDDEVEVPTAGETETAPEPEPERVPVGANASARRATPATVGRRSPARTRPRAAASARPQLIDPTTGQPIEGGFARLAAAMASRHNASAGGAVRAGYTERIALGRWDITDLYPEDRRLPSESSPRQVEEIVAAAIGDATDPARWDDSLVASGGFCAPTEVDYDIPQISEAMRPLRDALPRFQANRGGLRFPQPPTLADVVADSTANAAITVHDNDDDIAGTSKGVQTIDCAAFDEVFLQAIVRRLQFGNFGARAFPEQVETWNELALAAWSRTAETELLDAMVTASTDVTSQEQVGTAREMIRLVAVAAAGYRNRHRMRPDARLRVILPAWIVDAAVADLAMGVQSDPAFLAQTRADIVRYLANLGVNVSFYVDSPSTGTSQLFPAEVDETALDIWPQYVRWFIFHEGAFVFLDGGTLDLGIVRDSTLNATNDFQNFAESFEALAFRGIESLHVTSQYCVNGASAAGVEVTSCIGS